MHRSDALRALLDGEKIRMMQWKKGSYVYYDFEIGLLVNENGKSRGLNNPLTLPRYKKEPYHENRWEIYTKEQEELANSTVDSIQQ